MHYAVIGCIHANAEALQAVLEDIATEVTLSLDYFEGQIDQRVKEVYVSGGAALFPGIDHMLSKFFNLETDPREMRDLVDEESEEAVTFLEILAERINEVTTSAFAQSVESLEPSADQIKELRALGYID